MAIKKIRIRYLLLSIILIYLILIFIGQNSILRELNSRLEKIEASVEEEKKRQEDLKREIELLHTDDYIEKVAREELGFIKPNEKKYMDITVGN